MRLDHPVLALVGETRRLSLTHGSRAAWAQRYMTRSADTRLLERALPDHVHLFGLAARDAVSDDVVLRLQVRVRASERDGCLAGWFLVCMAFPVLPRICLDYLYSLFSINVLIIFPY